MTLVITGAALATVDDNGSEYTNGHIVVEGDRIAAIGSGPAPAIPGATIVDGRGCLVTPGLVNTHHHLYQWATRGMSQTCTLFEWLVELYPIWGRLDADVTHAAASGGLARLALTGCTTVADHHYVFPAYGGDQAAAVVSAADRIGTRLHLVRGSMDRGESGGGLPPDNIVEDTDAALAATEEAIAKYHDPAGNARVRVAVGPCSPFSVTERLMTGAAELARRVNVRMHTHLAETVDEDEQCRREFGCTPVEYAERLGWLGDDVWLAHAVHLTPGAISAIAGSGTGTAHCPTSNARIAVGVAPVADLLAAGVPVGLGVDGAASNESGGLAEEMHQALLFARQRSSPTTPPSRSGPTSLSPRQALWMATAGGARCLGRADDLGSLEVGKLADLAMWRLDGLAHAGIDDPVAALVLGAPAPLELLLVGGEPVVRTNQLTTVDDRVLARELVAAHRKLVDR
ncbi:MAG TPA: 8-oxoguanine deaminase [Pseudonocardiaceae bacterium]|jgi:cytosine/adenosine deaminase-related metal-dependent hydrolase|nr:8-oxoguanine deaminase [Pseudonocardiaceae bacterium]